jgi:hypothetical protein
MSSKGSGGSTTTTQELPAWAQPYAQQLLTRGADLSNQAVPTYNGQMTAGLSDATQAGIGGLGTVAGQSQNTANAATQYYQSLMGQTGPSLNNPYTGNVSSTNASSVYSNPANNPYLAQAVDAANSRITDAYSNVTAPTTLAQFRNAGAFGGSAQDQYTGTQQKQLAQALSDNTSGMYNSAYNQAAGIDANLQAQNAQQANQVALANQSVGTNANNALNTQNSSNYYSNINAVLQGLQGAQSANTAAGTAAGNLATGGQIQQQNSQDALNSAYQQWYNQVNAPYTQLSTLSGALSGALGSGTGVSTSSQTAGSGNSLATLLGLGATGIGAYNAFK